MKQQKKFLIGFLAIQLLCASQSWGVTAKVLKAKGKKVLIELPTDPRLQTGDSVQIDTQELRSPASMRSSPGARSLTLGASAGDLHFYSSNSSNSGETAINLYGRGGWNYVKYEYGPIAQINLVSDGSNNGTTLLALGGFFDFNLVPNSPGATDVYGLGGDAELATLSTKINGASASATGLSLNGGGFYKYFLFRTDTAIRFDADLHLGLYNSYTEVGLRFLAGIQTYF